MNRRNFIKIGISTLVVPLLESYISADFNHNSEMSLNFRKLKVIWYSHFTSSPKSYIAKSNLDKHPFSYLNKQELEAEKIIKVDGVYFSHLELAILTNSLDGSAEL